MEGKVNRHAGTNVTTHSDPCMSSGNMGVVALHTLLAVYEQYQFRRESNVLMIS